MEPLSYTGLVLCGGNSTRMKSDKGLIEQDGIRWAALAGQKLHSLGLPVYYSINEYQFDQYSPILPAAQLLVDHPVLPVKGPLKGILSAAEKFPEQGIFLLACDLPDIPEQLLLRLSEAAGNGPTPRSICYSYQEQPEPMCCIFQSSTLQKILEAAHQGLLEKFSMRYIVEHFGVECLPLAADEYVCFKNYNTPQDLA